MLRQRPIRAPFSRRWREFRFEYLPPVAFAISLLAAAVMWQQNAMPHKAAGSDWPEENEVDETPVLSNPVATMSPIPVSTPLVTNPPPALSD